MIFSNLSHKYAAGLSADIQKCFEYYKQNNLADKKTGSYEIDGRRIFVNIDEYKTQSEQERFWEAHRKYIDIHILIKGQEKIDMAFIENMQENPYDEAKDMLTLKGSAQASVNLKPGDFLICYPEDSHKTAMHVDLQSDVKKCIFKIRID